MKQTLLQMIAGKILKHPNILTRNAVCVLLLAFQNNVTYLGNAIVLTHTQSRGKSCLWELLM